MNQPLRIYIAGPYSPKDCNLHDAARVAQKNTNIAISIGNALMEKGHYVFVPHLTHYLHIHETCKVSDGLWWYEMDNSFLTNWANTFYYISPSKGADAELELAKKLGLKIFYSSEDVPIITSEIKDFTMTKIECPRCQTHYLYLFSDNSLRCSGGCGATIKQKNSEKI